MAGSWETYIAVPESQKEKACQVAYVADHERVINIDGLFVFRSMAIARRLIDKLTAHGISFNWATLDTTTSRVRYTGYVRYGAQGELFEAREVPSLERQDHWRHYITARGEQMNPAYHRATVALSVTPEFPPNFEQAGAMYVLSQMLIN